MMNNGPEFILLALAEWAEWAERHVVASNLSNRLNPLRMLLLNAPIGHIVRKYWIVICSER
ncbi:hypothetical protein BK416_12000 [Erwinia sp. OLSSP12]|nr:hypothetical protein BK416_12000 [Erwinia sp. OLSSP12]PIJ89485.1 hypothetical protein BL249_16115 [Erwinia sp. OLFS4]